MRIPLSLATVLVLASLPVSAQQREDLYSTPAKARYQTASFAGKRPLTRPERTNFTETSTYADVVAFIDTLKAMYGTRIETGSIGRTTEGRELPYVIASRPLMSSAEQAHRLGRPVAYIQANIHSGEVEGKEAMLAMLRDLLADPRPNVLDSMVLIVQPIYNADGNDRMTSNSRGSQNGPVMAGTRSQAANINLNRDYIGADAAETRASLVMLNRWKPDLFMDLHTTNGSVHGYALTYAPTLTPAAVTVAPYLFNTMMPEIRRRVRSRQGFEMNDYGDFSRSRPATPAPGAAPGGGRGGASLEAMIADSIPQGGWTFTTYSHQPRYGANYYGLRGRLSILSEAFSHDPFARRVSSTYAFVGEILSYVAEHRREVLALGRESDARIAAWANRPGTSPQLALRARMDTTRIENVRVEVVAPLTDTTKREMGMGNRQRTGVIKLVRMPMMVSFEGTLSRTLPFAYAFNQAAADSLVPMLKLHGIEVQQLTADVNVTAQGFTVDSIIDRGRNETPRNTKELRGRWGTAGARTLPAGTYIVPAGQPNGILAFYLLEAESDDGLTPFLNAVMRAGSEFPVARITARTTLPARAIR